METDKNIPIIEANDVTVRFPIVESADVYAVQNFNISIKPGEFVGLMGEPGCGKSTAAMSLLLSLIHI